MTTAQQLIEQYAKKVALCRLSELEPQFVLWAGKVDPTIVRHADVTIAEANGILFVCPVCWANNGRRRPGVHSIECFAPGVPLDVGLPGPGRWSLIGTGIEDLTLIAGSSSIKTDCAHFFIVNGSVYVC